VPRESAYQARLIKVIRNYLPGCIILKNDAAYLQGIPDLMILFNDRWAMLEVKRSAKEPYQPNQEFYLEMLDVMSFASVIYPENEDEVLYALQCALQPRRSARLSKR
jgi:hypothetical protein